MKVVSSWPDYHDQRIVAVTDEGEVYAIPLFLLNPTIEREQKWAKLADTIWPRFMPAPGVDL